MNLFYLRLVSMTSVLALCVMFDAFAVPTVKRLGGNSATTGATTVVKTANTTPGAGTQSRAASIRTKAVSSTKPSTTKLSSGTTDTNAARLSVGKYIHGAGVNTGTIKQVVSTPTITSEEVIDITDRVSSLENVVNTKQNVLSAGDGIILENDTVSIDTNVNKNEGAFVQDVDFDNGVLTVTKGDITIPVGAAESNQRAKIWIE